MSDQLTSRALSTAAELLQAAAVGDRFAMRRILRPLQEPGPDDEIGRIIRATADAHHVQIGRILGNDRRTEVVKARHAVCYIAVELFGHGYSVTGRAIGCDDSTVMNAVRKVSADTDRRASAEDIANRLGWAGAA